jgi:adenylate kinase family enzyme
MTINEIRYAGVPENLRATFADFYAKMDRLHKVQEEQMAWNARQEETNRKIEARVTVLEDKLRKAESDIAFLNNRIAQLDAKRDYILLQQSGTVPGGREHTKWQDKIMVLDNQIYSAESKLRKALSAKRDAERQMSA